MGGEGRNEAEADLSYKPPSRFTKITSVDDEATESGFDWSNIHDNADIDVWAIRIPTGLKASDLAGLKLKLPSGPNEAISGKLKKGGLNFTLYTVKEADTLGVGQEMENVQCLMPNGDEDGALYRVEKPLKRLVLTQQEPTPTPNAAPAAHAQPSQRPQPRDRLKHSFAPIGALPLSPARPLSREHMEVDEQPEPELPKKKHKKPATTVDIEAETPKGKSKSKSKLKAAPAITNEVMEIDGDDAPAIPKKSKKTIEARAQETETSVKKEKKRKMASEASG